MGRRVLCAGCAAKRRAAVNAGLLSMQSADTARQLQIFRRRWTVLLNVMQSRAFVDCITKTQATI